MNDWRTDDEVVADDRNEHWLQLEVVFLLLGVCAVLLRSLRLLG